MRWLALLLAGLIVCRANSAEAADDISAYVGRTVTSIVVTISGQPAPSEVLSLITVQKGAPLDLEALRVSVRSLAQVGRFERVVVEGTASASGVALAFDLVPVRPIEGIELSGDSGLPTDLLKELIRQQYGTIPTSVRPEEVSRQVANLLKDQGFLRATTSARTGDSPANPDHAIVIVSVQAGPRAVIRTVQVTGTSPLSTAAIRQETGAETGAPYRQRAIEDALIRIRERLRSDQHYEAQAVVDSNLTSDDGTAEDLVLHVDAGPRVLGPFFTGDPPPAGHPDDLVPMKLEQSDDDDLLDDAQTRIQALLQSEGYRDATASYTKTLGPEGRVISFAITRGSLYRVGKLDVTGNAGLSLDSVKRLMGITADEPFYPQKIDVGVLQVKLDYLQRGYYRISATPTFTDDGRGSDGARLIDIVIQIAEGPQAHVADIVFQPASPHIPVSTLRAAMRDKPGDPYVEAAAALDRDKLETLYHDHGFPNVRIAITATPSADDARAMNLTVALDEGPQLFVQDVRVIGNHRVDSPAVIDAMPLKAGRPLGTTELQRSRQIVQETFGFRTVSIVQEPVWNDPSHVHVIVTVEEAPATTIAWGGGILADRRLVAEANGTSSQHLDIGPRGSFEITRQNVGGRNRAIDFFSQVGVRSNPNTPENNFGFAEYVVQANYKDFRAFESNIDLSFGVGSQRDVQTDFNYQKQTLQADLIYRATRRLSITGQYALEFTRIFDQSIPTNEQLQLDLQLERLFPQVRLSTVSVSALWDRRNDQLEPSDGSFTTANVELAPKLIGSEVGFVKSQFQYSLYRAIDPTHRFIGAARVWVGLAHGFASQPLLNPAGQQVCATPSAPVCQPVFVAALPASERFYAGGGSSVRGFDQDVLGVPEIITNDGLSLGGNGLVVLNFELRTRLMRLAGHDFGVVTFVDGGNVFLNASNISLSQLRGTAGFGFRYNSPLGPIRLDYGFKFTRLPFGTSGVLEPGWTWHLSIGEAF